MNPSVATLVAAILLSACSMSPMTMAPRVDNAALPEAVRVPSGQTLRMVATGVGEITYECREKAAAAGQYEWAFVGPVATLYSADKRNVGKYYAGPTWEASDGSKVTGKQLAVSPSAPGTGRPGDSPRRPRDAHSAARRPQPNGRQANLSLD